MFGLGIGMKVALVLVVLLAGTGWALKHQYDAAQVANRARAAAEAAAKAMKEDHDAQLAALRRESADARERDRIAADTRAEIAAAEPEPAPVVDPGVSAPGGAALARPPAAPACARSRPVRALLDGLRRLHPATASPADPGAAAPVRARPSDSGGGRAAHGPRIRRADAARLAGGGRLPRQAGTRG